MTTGETVPDPALLTGIIGAAAGILGAGTPIVIERHNRKKSAREEIEDAAEDTVASWNSLNEALGREIRRLQDEINRTRTDYRAAMAKQEADYKTAMDQQRGDYEAQLDAARKRITELEADVASLRRILGQPPR